MIAAGTSAHSDHARGVAEVFLAAAKGEIPGYAIKDEQKLYQVALDLGVEIGDRSVKEIAIEVGEKCLAEFGRQSGELLFIKRAPLKRQEIWRKLGIVPRGIDREVVELMHRTHMGVDQDYRNLILARAARLAGRRLGRLDDLHRTPGHPVRQPAADLGEDQPRGAERGRSEHHRARPRAAAAGNARGRLPGSGDPGLGQVQGRARGSTWPACAARPTRC